MLIFDAHLDLSMNALEWNRDLTLPISEIRQREKGLTDKRDRGKGTVSFPEMRRGSIGFFNSPDPLAAGRQAVRKCGLATALRTGLRGDLDAAVFRLRRI